ncbi:hypothetical protein HYH02_002776 [Chlamydomonas schloesseri]|uniref:Uncharacterized protein n=1 Tax=Chlamydomonas schloesseri TaxID=2026947 RepID=A0A835WSK5_9CHLO|nr:hypothetical protein HYH02_002776 [Chlamydomonas schloesseri]|eukprot:KAG2452538.1 hypothetical protein HYH02_002776 [Chlamydomonas schloesseri]
MESLLPLREAEARERQSEAAVRLFQATVEAALVVDPEGLGMSPHKSLTVVTARSPRSPRSPLRPGQKSYSDSRPTTAPPDSPSKLQTSPAIYMGALSPERKKYSNQMTATSLRCADVQPRSPLAPPGVSIKEPWVPFQRIPMPPQLVFETWWHEAGKERVHMHVTYDTVGRTCTAGTNVSLALQVTKANGQAIDEYDLHVGAELRIAGRKVTIRKAVTLATLTWLDQQARAMLVAKYRLESELAKFRPVVPVPGQYTEAARSERFDLGTHQHLPAGGRLNLRALFNWILGLAEQLRQHRVKLPPLPDEVVGRVGAAVDALPGPPDWSPDRRETERMAVVAEVQQRDREAEAREREAHDEAWRNDLMNWLSTIPLAQSCCAAYTAAKPRPIETGQQKGGGGRPRAAAGALAFQASVVSRYNGVDGGGPPGTANGGTRPGVSRVQSMAKGPVSGDGAATNRTVGGSGGLSARATASPGLARQPSRQRQGV